VKLFVIALHVLICLSIIGVVLLQQGRGADIGAAFGAGASNTVFGSRGAGNFLTKLTTGFAIAFMVTSLVLAYVAVPRSLESVVGSESGTAGAEPAPAPAATGEAEPIDEPGDEAPSGFEAIEPPAKPEAPALPAGSPSGSEPAAEGTPPPG
jgi:preprotein translocase subunit SecG